MPAAAGGNEAAAPLPTNSPANSGTAAADVPVRNDTAQEGPAARRDRSEAGPAGDACRSRQYRHLVGQPRSRIPAKPAGETWRVTCTSCPVTMDYSERRLNFLYDEETGIIDEVRCG